MFHFARTALLTISILDSPLRGLRMALSNGERPISQPSLS
jgi:hypothetical protein